MRNLNQHPITISEKEKLIDRLKTYIYNEQQRSMRFGNTDLATIVQIEKDIRELETLKTNVAQ